MFNLDLEGDFSQSECHHEHWSLFDLSTNVDLLKKTKLADVPIYYSTTDKVWLR